MTCYSPHRTTKEFLDFIKVTVHAFVFLHYMCFIQRWLIGFFLKMSNLIGLLEFHIALSKILSTACADQLLYNLYLIKLCSTCAKQNAGVNTSDACSLLAKWTLSDLVGQHPSSLIINFEHFVNSFLIWNIYFTLFLPSDDCTFY